MHEHLLNCEHFIVIVNLMKLWDIYSMKTSTVEKEYLFNTVLSNFHIGDSYSNWSQLLFLEAFYIKTLAPEIENDKTKSSKIS